MHGAGLADEARTEFLADRVHGHEKPPEAIRVFGIIGPMLRILVEPDWIRNLDRHGPDLRRNLQRRESRHELAVEIGDASWRELNGSRLTAAGDDPEYVIDEIELDLENPQAARDRRSRKAAGAHVERDFPPVIQMRAEREAQFTHHLRPHVQRRARVAPFGERQPRPRFIL
jgi:hypothetical protein